MNALSTVGRILFALPFAVFGIKHFLMSGALKAYVPSYLPVPVFWVYLSGLGFLAAAVAFIAEKQVRLAGILLGAMLLVFVLLIHLPGLMNPEMMQMALTNLLKDTSLAGAAFYIAGRYSNQPAV